MYCKFVRKLFILIVTLNHTGSGFLSETAVACALKRSMKWVYYPRDKCRKIRFNPSEEYKW